MFASGCVSTVSEPTPLKAVVSNAETSPQALKSARQQAAQQRQTYQQHQQGIQEFPAPLRQPNSVRQAAAYDKSEVQDVLDLGEPNDLSYSDLSPPVTRDNRVEGKEERSHEKHADIDTKGVPLLPGVRLLGVVSTQSGVTRYMVKQQGQVAAVATGDKELLVNGRGYRIKGTGAEGVVVEDGQGQSFLIRR